MHVCVGILWVFVSDLTFHLSHWPAGPKTSREKEIPADRATSLGCDNAGIWKSADDCGLKDFYCYDGKFTVDSLFQHGFLLS